jgi:hypothetical protein
LVGNPQRKRPFERARHKINKADIPSFLGTTGSRVLWKGVCELNFFFHRYVAHLRVPDEADDLHVWKVAAK